MIKLKYRSKSNKLLSLAPTRIIVSSFAFIILVGALLLTLPAASKDGNSIGFLNALFTATSATCVTGLVVADTGTHWTLFGQIVIITLIQIGGLGLVTFATFFSLLLGKKLSLKGMLLAQESINNFSLDGVLTLVKKVVIITFGIELFGAVLLSTRFVPMFGPKGFYMGIFHSISAFCNAGFDIIGGYKSLTEFNNDPIIIYTIAGLIIVGGLGFTVWKDLFYYRKTKSLYLHTKIVLVMTALLIVCGTIFFFSFEYNNPLTMGNLSLFEKVNAAYFHSVTTRTAGFNSLPTNEMREISKAATVILMFIGAAPGSTGGGIKVTTFGVILMVIICQIKGSEDTIIFKRRVPHVVTNKAIAITGLSAMLVIITTTIIMANENIPFINVLYEATSAFGTVGISTGITPGLKSISKIALICTMFLGRVGPVSFAIALTIRSKKKDADLVYPEGKILVG
jgi:trk system potassium uptake protein TrkH